MNNGELVLQESIEQVKESEVPNILSQIRPSWQSKNLIERVKVLLEVDTSSACQRLFNASIHDLREKVTIAGIDIAEEAADQYGLPPLKKIEDIEKYSTSKLIDLSYYIGLLTRPEWRRLSRCYEIRRDLEHEDNEYVAGVEDCVYIFKTCIEVVLSRDPIHILKVTDIKSVIEESTPVTPADSLCVDYQSAPQSRQEEIMKFLKSYALNRDQLEIVQQNAFAFLKWLEPITQNNVKLSLATHFQFKIGRSKLDRRHVRVAYAMGVLPYLKSAQRADYFQEVYEELDKIGTDWNSHYMHGEVLRNLRDVGGLNFCPDKQRYNIFKWLVLTYIGVSGGKTRYGNIRHVYYSDTAAPIIREIITEAKTVIFDDLGRMIKEPDIKSRCNNRHVSQRFDSLVDIIL